MLTKLLKYDLKYMLKNMIAFYILSIFFAILTRILFEVEQSVIINIISRISLGCMVAMIANTLINTVIRSWVRFKDSLYKDESYLTHTLPVTKNDLYNSKFLQTLIFFIIGFIVVILSLFITFYSKDNWALISNYVKNLSTGLNMSSVFLVTMFLLVCFLEIFNAIQCGFLGMILGHQQNSGKQAFSVLFGFAAYMVSQTLVLALMFIYGLFDPTVMELFKTSTVSVDVNAFKLLLVLSSILYVLLIYGMSLLCKKFLNKGVNVD